MKHKPFLINDSIYITWFQCLDDPNSWHKYRMYNTSDTDAWNVITTDELINNPENDGKLAMVCGNFSIPGMLFIIKDNKLQPAKFTDFLPKTLETL